MLLPSRTKKFVDLINEVEFRPKEINYILNKYKISSATLIRLSNELNNLIHPSKLVSNGNILSLELANHHSSDYCISKALQNSLEYNLLLKIFFDESYTISSLAEALFTSESTIKRTIKDINLNLSPLNYKISTKPVRIIGDEIKIRHFFIILIKEMFGLENLPFKNEDLYFVEQVYNNLHTKFGSEYCRQDLLNLQLFSLVSLQREINSNTFTINPNLISNRETIINSLISKKPNLFIPEYKGVSYIKIFHFLLTDRYFLEKNDDLSLNNDRIKKIGLFLDEIEHVFIYKYSEDNRNKLLKKIYDIIWGYLSIPDSYESANNYYKKFFNENDFFLENMNDIFKIIFNKHFQNTSKNNMYMIFFSMITETDNLLENFMKNIKPVEILVYVNFDFSFNSYLKNKLKLILPGENTLKFIDERQSIKFDESFFNDYDLVITNHFFDDAPKIDNYIIISHFLSEIDLTKIKKLHSNILKKKFNTIADEMIHRALSN
ncbi:helix-turn-helix domain-containing protein [Vagococcus xieshaowenii]|uniref:Mga helix-turn-helix domain-containing protein n=1 Tax=Vagococcus xieshaowenii TaxID=2562451 RepID=A0AAJ5EE54_9ENTE|nr:helix-turn-helix domain-containing protein [Vagococcus xieshaowenii]QCA28954.1 hypothetical protein E4Z98_06350 [Vagococcus xieshaowenii]TFZ39234.1 hypothetical protein E4031_09515 [Vagococcus xieshaowenii]